MASVLLIDDDADIREAEELVLADAGYEVTCAGNPDRSAVLHRGPCAHPEPVTCSSARGTSDS